MFDFRRHKTKIAEVSLKVLQERYPAITTQKIEECIERHHDNQKPESEEERFVRDHLIWIETAIKKGWIK